MAEKVVYNDPTPNHFPADYDDSQVDSRVKTRSKSIAHKERGEHVREALMQGIEIGSVVANEAKNIANDTASRQDDVDQSQKDFEDRYNNQIAGNTDIKEVIDARQPTNKTSYVTLGERLNVESTPVYEEASLDIDIDQSLNLGGKLSGEVNNRLEEFKANLPEEGFRIAVISDSHFEDMASSNFFGAYPQTKDALTHVTAFNKLADSVDVMIALGDNVNGCYPIVDKTIADGSDYADLITYKSGPDRFVLPGNHDDGSAAKYINYGDNQTILPLKPNQVINNSQFKDMFRTRELINGEKRDNGSLYFYKDYQDAKVRIVGLYTEDVPEDILNSDGSIKYDRYWYHTYSQQQINWIANVALMNVPADYSVFIVAHAPINNKDAKQYNNDMMKSVLDAFCTGGSYNGSSSTEVPNELRISVNCNYTTQGTRKIAGFLAGHIHTESIMPLTNFTLSTVTCDANKVANLIGTADAMAFQVVTIQPDKVLFNGFGRATDREYSY